MTNVPKAKTGRPPGMKSFLSRRNMLIGIVGMAGGGVAIGGAAGVFSSSAAPAGMPGMPGNKPDRLSIYEIGKGSPKVYATV